MTADVLRDYMLGQLSSLKRQEVRREIAADPKAANALRRVRNIANALRATLGKIDNVPGTWIELLKNADRNDGIRPMGKFELSRERSKTWL